MLDIAGGDPLRAMAIEEQISEEWWARALVYRIERQAALGRKGRAPAETSTELSPPVERQCYMLTPSGQLRPATEET